MRGSIIQEEAFAHVHVQNAGEWVPQMSAVSREVYREESSQEVLRSVHSAAAQQRHMASYIEPDSGAKRGPVVQRIGRQTLHSLTPLRLSKKQPLRRAWEAV